MKILFLSRSQRKQHLCLTGMLKNKNSFLFEQKKILCQMMVKAEETKNEDEK